MSSQEVMLNGSVDAIPTSASALEVLQHLQVVPGAREALAIVRRQGLAPSGLESQADLICALRSIHQRLLAEGSPDYWIQDFHPGEREVDMDQMDLAVEAAAARLLEAACVADLIASLETRHATQQKYVTLGSSPSS